MIRLNENDMAEDAKKRLIYASPKILKKISKELDDIIVEIFMAGFINGVSHVLEVADGDKDK